jgi:Hemerythrin HHE cation binding domain
MGGTVVASVASGRRRWRRERIEDTLSRALPRAIGPLQAERDRLDQIIEELGVTDDSTERADMAAELVRSCSRLEDVKDRCVYPALETLGTAVQPLASIREDEISIRDAMEVIRKRTVHMSPANVRADDPDGFDDTLDGLLAGIQKHLQREEQDLFPLLDNLSPETADDLAENVTKALKHASEKPKPSHNRIGHAIGNLGATLDRTLEDVSTPLHPGRDKLDETDIT